MAEVVVNIDKEKDLTTVIATGTLSTGDIADVIKSFYNNPTKYMLLNAYNCKLDSLSPTDLEEASKLISKSKVDYSPGKTAFVLERTDFSLGVLFETFTKIEHLPREYRSFTLEEEAKRWLSESC